MFSLCYLDLMFHVVFRILSLVIYMLALADRLAWSGKRELMFTCNYAVSVLRGFLFRIGCIILL